MSLTQPSFDGIFIIFPNHKSVLVCPNYETVLVFRNFLFSIRLDRLKDLEPHCWPYRNKLLASSPLSHRDHATRRGLGILDSNDQDSPFDRTLDRDFLSLLDNNSMDDVESDFFFFFYRRYFSRNNLNDSPVENKFLRALTHDREIRDDEFCR